MLLGNDLVGNTAFVPFQMELMSASSYNLARHLDENDVPCYQKLTNIFPSNDQSKNLIFKGVNRLKRKYVLSVIFFFF